MRKFSIIGTLVLTIVFLAPSIILGQKLSGKFCMVGDELVNSDRYVVLNGNNNINNSNRLIDPNGVIIIPVVFHVLYNPAFPDQYVSDARIMAQLNRLNTDFRKLNPDISLVPSVWTGLAADMKFEFKMACISPTGAPTNGIERLTTNIDGYGGPNLIQAKRADLGGLNAWPTNTYLNIWICAMEFAGGGGIGSFPWDYTGTTIHPVTFVPISNSLLDGVVLSPYVVDNPALPERDLSRVGVHEVGHWLGLWHTYQRGCSNVSYGDEVSDTPPQQGININCPNFPLFESYPFCDPNPNGVMFMNYMDQTNDDCKYMFTIGQRDRARALFSQNPPINPETGNPYFTRYPFLANYFGIKSFPTTPHIVVNNTITVQLKNPACLPATYTFSGPVTEISHNDQQIVFSVPCGLNGTFSLNASAGNYTDDLILDFENSGSASINITPSGPIEYYFNNEVLNKQFTFVTTNQTGNQWFLDGNPVSGATGSSFVYDAEIFNSGLTQSHTISVQSSGCNSNTVIVSFIPYNSCQIPISNQCYPSGINTPFNYCENTTGYMKSFDLGPLATYTWEINQPGSIISISNQSGNTASINISNSNPLNPFIGTIAKSELNGHIKYFDYFIWVHPFLNSGNLNGCYSASNTVTMTTQGSLLDNEFYDFGNADVLSVSPALSPPYYFTQHTVYMPGSFSVVPRQIVLSLNGALSYTGSYTNNYFADCYSFSNQFSFSGNCFGKPGKIIQDPSKDAFVDNTLKMGFISHNSHIRNLNEIHKIEIYNFMGQLVLNVNSSLAIYQAIYSNRLPGLSTGVFLLKIYKRDNSAQTIKKYFQ